MPTGMLYICPTPIGNLGDVTVRTLEVLRSVDVVCAEDTRVTGKLLAAYGISKPIERLDEEALSKRGEYIVERIALGEKIAYCSDAGMPGVSDPGLRLVEAARAAKVNVEVLPGASAVTTAYVTGGFLNPQFYFGGFLPRKRQEQIGVLSLLKSLDACLVFYESPVRLVASLSTIAEIFPYREVAVCRELTKLHEEVYRGLSSKVHDTFRKRKEEGSIKGEIVIVIDAAGAEEQAVDTESMRARAQVRVVELKAQGLHTNKDIVALLQSEFSIPRNTAYDIVVGK